MEAAVVRRSPAVYVLETSYAGRKILDRRIARLESTISNDAVKGDQRVNWLLARAHAEEILDGGHNGCDADNVVPLVGRIRIEPSFETA